jgi:hypothetical protein
MALLAEPPDREIRNLLRRGRRKIAALEKAASAEFIGSRFARCEG